MVVEQFVELSAIWRAVLATSFTWFVTALGATTVFFFKQVNRKLLDGMLGFAAGLMIAAIYWSLLAPAIQMAQETTDMPTWLPVAFGFLSGGAFIRMIDLFLPHLPLGYPVSEVEGINTNWRRSIRLVLAITLHNFSEGLAVGVAFGAVAANLASATLAGAVTLAIGIGIQNFSEGVAVSVPLRAGGMSPFKSFWYGQSSAIVEPIAGMIGAATVVVIKPILPYALAFAAGAMVFVVVEELIPESQLGKNTDIATLSTMLGFVIMMILAVALG